MNPFIRKPTHYFDIDGTVIYQPDGPEGFCLENGATPNAVNLVNALVDDGHCVIFTTARDEEFYESTKAQLDRCGFKYDRLLMRVGSGKRVVWNNTKTHTNDTAGAVVVQKNMGILPENIVYGLEHIV